MGTLKLSGTSGDVSLVTNNPTGNFQVTVPNATAYMPVMQLMTSQTANGTSVDFTGIPSWAKKITVMFNGVSTNGTSVVRVQIGSGSIQTTGYHGDATVIIGGSAASATLSSGFDTSYAGGESAGSTRLGMMEIMLFNNYDYIAKSSIGQSQSPVIGLMGGGVTLSGALDRVRITTVNGTDTFDAGTINILVEGY